MKRVSIGKRTHGESHTTLHNIWCGINNRCDPTHAHSKGYGRRGIKICEEWYSYESFAEWARKSGYEEGLTIERIDVNGDYCPENCMWIPHKKQARNRRTTSWVEYRGRTMSLAEACEIAKMDYKLVWHRINVIGWTFEQAISTPKNVGYRLKTSSNRCIICGKEFTSHSSRSKYCSHECYLVYRTAMRHGHFNFTVGYNDKY